MFSTRSFSLFVTVACAAFSTCAPIGDLPLDLIPGSVAGQTTPGLPTDLTGLPIPGSALTSIIPAGGLPNVGLPSLPSLPAVPRQEIDELDDIAPELDDLTQSLPRQLESVGDLVDVDGVTGLLSGVGALPRDVEHPSLPEVFQTLAVKISPVADQLKAAVSLKADIEVEVVVGLLHDLIEILTVAITEVQYIVDHPTEFVLSLAGTILSITQVASIIASVLSIVIPLLAVVVGAVEGAVAAEVLPLVAEVGSLVASLLSLALALVPGLLAVLLPLITGLVSIIYHLSLADVVAILGLPALA